MQFTTRCEKSFWNCGLNAAYVCFCRDDAQSHVQGFPQAKFKKFKTQPEAEQWYISNLPRRPAGNQQTTNATPSTSTAKPPSVARTTLSSAGVSSTSWNQPAMAASKPVSQPIPKAVIIPVPKPAQPLRIAAPKNTTVDIVYSDGACKGNGARHAVAGIGVWWGPNDPRYKLSFPPSSISYPQLIGYAHKEPIREMSRSPDKQQGRAHCTSPTTHRDSNAMYAD